MVKRKLTDEETKIYNKRISALQQQFDIVKGEIKRLEFNDGFLLEHNYKKARIGIRGDLTNARSDLIDFKEKIEMMMKHLNEGVEVKKKEDK